MNQHDFIEEHSRLTRRYFLKVGVAGVSALPLNREAFADEPIAAKSTKRSKPEKAGAQREPYFTLSTDFRDVSRGKPLPHLLTDEKKREVGLTRETWSVNVISDPDHPATLGKPLSKEDGSAFDFESLLKLGEKCAVRFPKVMTCLNLGCPLGMGLWEGVPLREVIWLAQPRENVRRVFYYGYHNDDPKQMFRSSLPIGRVLEDPFDLPPVILCYKLNGQWLDSERGGPVRMVVPEAYGFKSIKWLSHLVLTNLAYANDTYADQNNDVDSMLKTFAATLSISKQVKAGEPIAVSGYAQVGVSGLSKVQVAMELVDTAATEDDLRFVNSPWVDAELFPAPTNWSGLADGRVPPDTHGFHDDSTPKRWPIPFTNAHWAVVLPGLAAGDYVFRCRTIDEREIAQPLPRPFQKSGHAAIESIAIAVRN